VDCDFQYQKSAIRGPKSRIGESKAPVKVEMEAIAWHIEVWKNFFEVNA